MAKRNLTKQGIIASAAELCEKIGLENLNFQRLAEYLGIKHPSLYNHLKNIGDLKYGMSLLLLQKMDKALTDAVIGKSGDDAIFSLCTAYRRFALDHPELYKTIVWVPADHKLINRGKEISGTLKQIIRSYSLNEQDTDHKSRELRSLLHGFVSLENAGYFQSATRTEESFTIMVRHFIEGIEK